MVVKCVMRPRGVLCGYYENTLLWDVETVFIWPLEGRPEDPSGPDLKSTYGTLSMEMGNLASPNTYWKMDTTSDPYKTS